MVNDIWKGVRYSPQIYNPEDYLRTLWPRLPTISPQDIRTKLAKQLNQFEDNCTLSRDETYILLDHIAKLESYIDNLLDRSQ